MVDLLLIRARDAFINPDKPAGFGVIVLASYLRAHGFQVIVLDMNLFNESTERFTDRIAAIGPRVIGISAMHHQFYSARDLGRLCRERFSARIISGGMHFNVYPHDGLSYGHAVVTGEGEKAMVEILGMDEREVKGFFPGTPLDNLDDIPLPDDDIIDATTWNRNEYSMMTSRGCPFNCLFCINRDQTMRTMRYHSPEYVCDYMSCIIRQTGIKRFFFVDDIFILNKERVYKVCEEIERRRIGVQLRCFGHGNISDLELFKRMKSVGFYEIQIGVESGSQDILDRVRKSTTLEKIERSIKLIRKAGISPLALFMIGNIGETRDTIKQSIRFARKLKARSWFSYALPLPGTEFYEVAHKFGRIIADDWQLFSNEDLAFIPNGLDEKTMRSMMKRARRIRYAIKPVGKSLGVV